MKRDLITKHPLLPESKHMLYCTYTPHLLYSQAHLILMHTVTPTTLCHTHTRRSHIAHRSCLGSRGFTLHGTMASGHGRAMCALRLQHMFLLQSHTPRHRNAGKHRCLAAAFLVATLPKNRTLLQLPSSKHRFLGVCPPVLNVLCPIPASGLLGQHG